MSTCTSVYMYNQASIYPSRWSSTIYPPISNCRHSCSTQSLKDRAKLASEKVCKCINAKEESEQVNWHASLSLSLSFIHSPSMYISCSMSLLWCDVRVGRRYIDTSVEFIPCGFGRGIYPFAQVLYTRLEIYILYICSGSLWRHCRWRPLHQGNPLSLCLAPCPPPPPPTSPSSLFYCMVDR